MCKTCDWYYSSDATRERYRKMGWVFYAHAWHYFPNALKTRP